VREEIWLYIIAKELKIDIDEVKSWSAEKILKWSIALKIMSKEINNALKSTESPRRHLFVFR